MTYTPTATLVGAARKGEINFDTFINAMTFKQFVIAFGTLMLPDENGVEAYRPWNLWPGGDGNPGQPDVAEMLPKCRVFYSPKARQKGMTELWSMYCAYVLMKEKKNNAKAFGSGTKQTKEIMELRFKTKIEGMLEVYPEIPWPRWEIGTERAECENGSYLLVYSSENTGAHGGSPRLTLLDEGQNYEGHNFKEMLKGIGPSLRGNKQLAILGTSRPGSDFNATIEGVMGRHPEVSKNVWLSNDKTADGRYHMAGMVFLNDYLDPEHLSTVWQESQLNEIFGGDTIAFRGQHPLVIQDMFSSHEGKVISSWDPARHVFDRRVTWEPHQAFYLVYDHGATQGHPAVCLFIHYDPHKNFVYVFDEVFLRAKELSFVCMEINKKLAMWRAEWEGGGPAILAYGDVAGKYGARSIGEVMREEMAISFITVDKQNKPAQIELAKARFFRGQSGPGARDGIGFHSRVRHSVKQITDLKYKEGKDEPEDAEDDAMDALRYAINEIYKREPVREPTYEELQAERIAKWKARSGTVQAVKPGYAIETSWLAAG